MFSLFIIHLSDINLPLMHNGQLDTSPFAQFSFSLDQFSEILSASCE